MTEKQYREKRNTLMNKAQELLNSGKLEEAKAARGEIEKLDNDWDEITKEMANIAALKGSAGAIDLTNKSVNLTDGTSVEKFSVIGEMQNKTELYTSAVAKLANKGVITKEEEKAVNLINKQYENAFGNYLISGGESCGEFKDVFDLVNSRYKNTADSQTTAGNAVIVPKTMKEQIWQEIGENHPVLSELAMTFIQGDLTIPKESVSGNDAEWYDEEDESKGDKVGFTEINLTGHELSKTITVSWKLKKMSIDAFLVYITTKIAEKMGNALAKGIVQGKGKPGASDSFKAQPKGIITAIEGEEDTPQIITYTGAVTYDNVVSAMAVIKSGYASGAKIYAKNNVIWNQLAKIKSVDGIPLFVPDVTTGGVGRMFGLAIQEEDAIPDNCILIANIGKGYIANANENITMYYEEHAKARETDYMGYAIIDGDVITTKAFAYLKKA